MIIKFKKKYKKLFFDLKLTTLDMSSKPISLGIVSDCGKSFYCEFNDYNENDLVKNFSKDFHENLCIKEEIIDFNYDRTNIKGSAIDVRKALQKWICQFKKCEFIGDYTPYKWMVFCEIFGGNKFIPKNINKFPYEIKQMAMFSDFEFEDKYIYGNENINNSLNTSLCIKKFNEKIELHNKPKRYYVYKYLDLKGNTFYIGKGSDRRALFHLYQATKENIKIENLHKTNKIKNILNSISIEDFIKNNIVIIKDNIDEKYALELEKELILKYGRINIGTGCLTNITEGGDFCIGNYEKSESHRIKISKTLTGKKKSLESKIKQSKSNSGKNNPMYNQTHTEEARNKISLANSKPVNINGIKYKSITEASKKLGVSRTTIVRRLNK